MPVATYGPKEFSVSFDNVYTFDDLQYKASINTETQESEGLKSSTWIKGQNLDQMSFIIALDAMFVDVKAEIDDWMDILDAGQPYPFTVGGAPLSEYPFLLKDVSASEYVIAKPGMMLKAKLNVSFEEYVRPGSGETQETIRQQDKAAAMQAKAASKKTTSKAKKGKGIPQSINITSLVDNAQYKRVNPNADSAVAAGAVGG